MNPNSKAISIPYGAIKRYTTLGNIFFLFSISIPYGAIKRYFVLKPEQSFEDFNSLWCD